MSEPIDYTGPYVESNITPDPALAGPSINVSQSEAFGPDYEKAEEPKTTRQKRKLNDTSLGKLGQNKKARSGIRKLTDDDKEKIESLYIMMSMGLMPFRPDVAQALANIAEPAAQAWFDLANENDAVRRTILMLIEGGAWGKLFAAHTPLFIALVPREILPQQIKDMLAANEPAPTMNFPNIFDQNDNDNGQ